MLDKSHTLCYTAYIGKNDRAKGAPEMSATLMTYNQMVLRNGSTIKYEINDAVSKTIKALDVLGLAVEVNGKLRRGAIEVLCTGVTYDVDDDNEESCLVGSTFNLYIFRNGAEFVAIPDQYEGEDCEFEGTLGGQYVC